ncbi:MAG: alkaline phosphatase family protein [Pirellulaceae bacterium]|nr:alkaline phosphatase family protein [Pirellulaceae bacterium]
MSDHVVVLSIPGLRAEDLSRMPHLSRLTVAGDRAPLAPSTPAVTWPVQANMLTGELPSQHGVVANGFYWRDERRVEMWTANNEKILKPQIWDILHQYDEQLTSAVWFPMLSKGSKADYVCMPAPIHNPDGSESLWCYTTPTELYGDLRDEFGHFPLQNFWGPLASIKSSAWIADSVCLAARRYKPRFAFVYLPHLDYAAQKTGPDSPKALKACAELDEVIGRMVAEYSAALAGNQLLWLVASEYAIVPVNHVTYPNRLLRAAGLLAVKPDGSGEQLDFESSRAWVLVDHQVGHVFIDDPADLAKVVDCFRGQDGIDEVLIGEERAKYGLDHERSGEIVLISSKSSWQAYYWWEDDQKAPSYARTVDIHRKPGYDPVEMHLDRATMETPLDATLVRGSHGAPAHHEAQCGVLLSSQRGVFVEAPLADTDVFDIVLRQFGI